MRNAGFCRMCGGFVLAVVLCIVAQVAGAGSSQPNPVVGLTDPDPPIVTLPGAEPNRPDPRFGTVGREGAELLHMNWYATPGNPIDVPGGNQSKLWHVGVVPDQIDLATLGLPGVDTDEIPFGVIWSLLELPDDVGRAACLVVPFIGQEILNDPSVVAIRDVLFIISPTLFAIALEEGDVGGWDIVDADAMGVPGTLTIQFQPCENGGFTLSINFDVAWDVEIEIFGPNPTISFLSEFRIELPIRAVGTDPQSFVLAAMTPQSDDISIDTELIDFDATGIDFIDDYFSNLALFALAISGFSDNLEAAIEDDLGPLLASARFDVDISLFRAWVANTFFFGQSIPDQRDILRLMFDVESQLITFRILGEGRVGEFWAVGDAPNFYPYFKPRIYAEHYARYHDFIKTLDPTATVLTGGLTITEMIETPGSFAADYFALNVNNVLASSMLAGVIFDQTALQWYDAFAAALPAGVSSDLANLQLFPVGATVRQRVWSRSGNCGARWTVGDFDGDGRDDIMRHLTNAGGAQVLLSTGTGFSTPITWTSDGNCNARWTVGDFDGDGRDDIARNLTSFGGAEVYLSDGTKFSRTDVPGGAVLTNCSGNPARPWTGYGNRGRAWYVADANGDGNDDLFRQLTTAGGAEVLLSLGDRFEVPVRWNGYGNLGMRWYVGDFNGDGRDDIMRQFTPAGGADVFLSKLLRSGSAFVPAYYREDIDLDAIRTTLDNTVDAFHAREVSEVWIGAFGNLDWLMSESQVADLSYDTSELFKCQPRVSRWFWHASLPVDPVLGGPPTLSHLAVPAGPGELVATQVGAAYASAAEAPVLECELDVNLDECVDVSDVIAVIDATRGTAPYPESWYDVNRDGVLNIADARFVVTGFTNPSGASCTQP